MQCLRNSRRQENAGLVSCELHNDDYKLHDGARTYICCAVAKNASAEDVVHMVAIKPMRVASAL